MLESGRIKGKFTKSSACDVCKHAKIKNRPHSKKLPMVTTPFYKPNMDTLQISPPTRKGHQYVLVIIDDFSRFNRVYPMCKKDEAERHLESYLGEIKNKLGIIPALLHSDRGGEFSSTVFINKLKSQGICTEQGPPNSPETNGVAERFNQSLLTKVRCLFSQSDIPMSYWDDAVNHASLLLNYLPHKYLNMKSPMEILSINGINIEPTISLEIIIPFGMKVIVKTIANPNGLRVLDPKTGCIRISRDYATSSSEITTVVRQTKAQLPKAVNLYITLKTSKNKYPLSVSEEHLQNSIEEQEQIEPIPASVNQELVTNKHYQYVPYYKEPEKHISSSISSDNIIEGKILISYF
ncbi:hypothetical protein O181_114175 [Austropuccinia psidii MF-1]|uniref:Integrase catalytic domain-containing protein n=1 Tax=Austropuccinia psidii MF-1 TaxID=1389203 RepID=A0A9Q3PV93_9BASI|nr:hypothetical protein [Austropuccinia psidii MF-1]